MLAIIAWISLGISFVSAVILAVDEARHPQKMWIMNIVWPATALYFRAFAIVAYFRFGRPMNKVAQRQMDKKDHEKKMMEARANPSWTQVSIAVSHCGSGCVIADIFTEFTLFGFAVTLIGSALWATYLYDFISAWTLGVAFQYFTIKPMLNLSPMEPMRIDQILEDTHRVAASRQLQLDHLAVWLAGSGRPLAIPRRWCP